MTKAYDPVGYKHGRSDGYELGKQDGYKKGVEAARAAAVRPPLNAISLKWRERVCADKLSARLGADVVLNDRDMECLKETDKSAVWRLEIAADGKPRPIILKIFKAPITDGARVELNMYRHAGDIMGDMMPAIYTIEDKVNGEDAWTFMEFVPPLKGRVIFTPDHFDRIIPALAQLHAQTFNDRFYSRLELFADWLPRYDSDAASLERMKTHVDTLKHAEQAAEQPELKRRLDAGCKRLHAILRKGPIYFPELNQAGKSIIHNDLQTPNIGCANVDETDWRITFLDWEGARFAPCWFDLFNLIGVFFAYRKDWRSEEEAVIRRCAPLYASEMGKHGIRFAGDPVRLYKMAYLQRVLERSLYLQLHWALEGQKPAYLLDHYLERIDVWGKELGL